MKSILLVEDDTTLGEVLSTRLGKDYNVRWAQTCRDARKIMHEVLPTGGLDLAIFDVGLPDGEGFELARYLKEKSKVPFIMLTAQSDADSRLRGYDMGAQEYIPKPFLLRELLIRIQHVLDEHGSVDPLAQVYKIGDLEIRLTELRVKVSGAESFMTASEAKLLEILLNKSPNLVTRDDLINHIWGMDSEVSPRTLDNMITKLRQTLGSYGEMIKTARGAGYLWTGEEK